MAEDNFLTRLTNFVLHFGSSDLTRFCTDKRRRFTSCDGWLTNGCRCHETDGFRITNSCFRDFCIVRFSHTCSNGGLELRIDFGFIYGFGSFFLRCRCGSFGNEGRLDGFSGDFTNFRHRRLRTDFSETCRFVSTTWDWFDNGLSDFFCRDFISRSMRCFIRCHSSFGNN